MTQERLSAEYVATLGSLFAGVGGFDLGFEKAGFDGGGAVTSGDDCGSAR